MQDEQTAAQMRDDLTAQQVPVFDGAGGVALVIDTLGAGAEYPQECLAFVSATETLSPQKRRRKTTARAANTARIADLSLIHI